MPDTETLHPPPDPVPAAVARTLNDYAWGLDQNDLELTLSCYLPDAEVRITVDPAGEERGVFIGIDAIREMYRPSREAMEPGEQRRHYLTNVTVEDADGESATIRAYFLVIRAQGAAMDILTGGWFRFRMVEAAGAMRIVRGEIHLDAGFSTLVDASNDA